MAKSASSAKGGGRAVAKKRKKTAPAARYRAFVRGLSPNEKTALVVRDELYGGSWGKMRKDLVARAQGRPYVFKLASRIEEDLRATERLSDYERRHRVDLADFLEGEI